ncbi:unnamed protein product [Penicillium pancosmium]
MSRAEEEYLSKGRGSKNIGRRAFRKAGDYASAISPWVHLVPDDDGMNVLSGGLRLVFHMARTQAEAREKILNTFQDFVTILDATQIKRQIFRSNEKLRSCALDLYEAALAAITKLIRRLNRHHWWDRASALASAPIASATIADILFDVNKRLNDVHRCLDDIRDQKLNTTHQNVISSQTELHAVRLNTKTIEIDVRNLNDDFNHFAQQAQVDQEKIDSIQSGVERINENIDRLLTEHALDAKTGLYHMLLDTIRAYELQKTANQRSESPKYRILQLPQLLEALQIFYMRPTQDLEYVARQGHTFDSRAQMQAQSLTKTPEFQRWLASHRPDLLLVDGNAYIPGPGRISAMSVFCAVLVLGLMKSKKDIVLHFFCGQHTAAQDNMSGPKGLMRSIITQLLYCGKQFDIDFIDSRNYRESLEAQSLPHLCDIFCNLIEQLQLDTSVFCVVDGVSLYERDHWLDELCCVFETLNALVENEYLQPIFKLLLTSPFASRQLGHQTAASRKIVLRKSTVNGRLISEGSVCKNWRDRERCSAPSSNVQAEHGETSDEDEYE